MYAHGGGLLHMYRCFDAMLDHRLTGSWAIDCRRVESVSRFRVCGTTLSPRGCGAKQHIFLGWHEASASEAGVLTRASVALTCVLTCVDF